MVVAVALFATRLLGYLGLNHLNCVYIRGRSHEAGNQCAKVILRSIASVAGDHQAIRSVLGRTALRFEDHRTVTRVLEGRQENTTGDAIALADAYFALERWKQAAQQYYMVLSRKDARFHPIGKWLLSCTKFDAFDAAEPVVCCPRASSDFDFATELYAKRRGVADWEIEPKILAQLVESKVIAADVARYYLSYVYWQGEYSSSLGLARSLVEVTHADEDRIWVAKALIELGLYEEAVSVLESVPAASSLHADAGWLRDRILEIQGTRSALADYCEESTENRTYWPCVHQINDQAHDDWSIPFDNSQAEVIWDLGDDLLVNGSFEDMSNKGPLGWDWHIWTGSWMGIPTLNDGHFVGGVDTIDGLEGNAVRLQTLWVDMLSDKSEARAGYVGWPMSLSSEKTYHLSLFYRTLGDPTASLLWGERDCVYEKIALTETHGHWRHARILLDVPPCLEDFRLFLLVFTPGVAWFDEVKFSEVQGSTSLPGNVQLPYVEIH